MHTDLIPAFELAELDNGTGFVITVPEQPGLRFSNTSLTPDTPWAERRAAQLELVSRYLDYVEQNWL